MRGKAFLGECFIEFKHFRFFVCDEVNEGGVLEEYFAEEEVALDDFEAEGVGLDGEERWGGKRFDEGEDVEGFGEEGGAGDFEGVGVPATEEGAAD